MAHPNQYTKRTPQPGDVVRINRRCPTCGRGMVANYMGENSWCPFCKNAAEQRAKTADQIARTWGR